jgi:hypothetical protein
MQGDVMKSSNLALRLDDEQVQPARTAKKDYVPPAEEPAGPARPRPRRSPGFRSIVIRDQGFAPFRVR